METIKVNTSQHVDIDYPVAGLGERIAARLIDLAFFTGGLILLVMLMMIPGLRGNDLITGTLFVIYGAIYVFYNLLCEILMNGQSAGKRIMKIKVISIDGGQASLGQYCIRWLFRLVDFVLTGQVGGLICVAVSENKQRIGDIVAGTTVIKTIPRTGLEHIAFQPVEEDYEPVYPNAGQLADRDIELINEVLHTYYKTGNADIIFRTAAKIAPILAVKLPEQYDQLDFLNIIIKDYNHITSVPE